MTDRNTNYREGVEVEVLCAAATVIEAGKLVCINPSTGLLVPAADTATYLLAGVALEAKAVTTANQYVRVRRKGLFDFAATSITIAMQGSMMYVKDAQTFDNTSSNLVPCGRLVKHESATRGWIDIEPATLGTYNISVDGVIDAMPAMRLETGGSLTAFASAPTPGFAQLANKEMVLKWAANASKTAVGFTVTLPSDLDDASDVVIRFLAAMTGAVDTPTLGLEAYFGAGDTDCVADSAAITGTAVAEYAVTIAAADVPAGPTNLTVVITPTGTMTTNDLYIYGCLVEYTRKNAA